MQRDEGAQTVQAKLLSKRQNEKFQSDQTPGIGPVGYRV